MMSAHDDEDEEYSPNPLPPKLKPINWDVEKAKFFEINRQGGTLDIYYMVYPHERPLSRDEKDTDRSRGRGGRGR